MKVCGIIAEFNPFHNGHRYLIETARRELNPGAVVCVMSGDFVQRGEPAAADKYARARAAVRCGADLVAELPPLSAVNSAPEFAYGAVRTLKAMGCVTHLCFGSESGRTEELIRAAQLLAEEPAGFRAKLGAFLSEGLSYGAACEEALKAVTAGEKPSFMGFAGPNDILAVEYLKQLVLQNFKAEPYGVTRVGTGHDAAEASGSFASASLIRKLLSEGKDASLYIPPAALEEIQAYSDGTGSAELSYSQIAAKRAERLYELLRYRILTSTAQELSQVLSVSEGLENVMKKAVMKAENLDEFIRACKSRRYPYARISRMAMQTVLGFTKADYREFKAEEPCVKVLAFNCIGAEIMHNAKSTAKFITNVNKQEDSVKYSRKSLETMEMSAEVYGMISGKSLYNSSDSVNVPKIIKDI